MQLFKKQNAKCKYANIIAPHQAKMSRICKYVNVQNTPQGVQKNELIEQNYDQN